MNINDGFVKHDVSAELFLCSTKHFVAFNCLNVFLNMQKLTKGLKMLILILTLSLNWIFNPHRCNLMFSVSLT